MRNRIIQVRHYSRKMMIMMLTGAICCSSCFCQTAFAKTSKVRVYDAEKGTTSFTAVMSLPDRNVFIMKKPRSVILPSLLSCLVPGFVYLNV